VGSSDAPRGGPNDAILEGSVAKDTMNDSELAESPLALPVARRDALPLLQLLAFGAVYVIWGSTYLGIRVAVESIPPFLLAGLRSFTAGALLLGYLRLRGARAATAREWLRAALAGTILLTAGNGLVTWAEKYVPSSLAALSVAAVPAYVALLDWLRPGGQRPVRGVLVGVLLGLAGMLLLLRPDPAAIGVDRWLPLLALALAGFSWAVGSLYVRYQRLYPNALVSGGQQMLAGGAVLLVISSLTGEIGRFDPAAVTGRSLLAWAYLTVFGSLLAFSAFNWLNGVSTAARVSTTAYVNPVVAVLLGWLMLDEPLQPASLAGGALIICAVLVMTLARQKGSGAPAATAAPRMQSDAEG
jgi:drug/metabolite transporter (DMT)-like permease